MSSFRWARAVVPGPRSSGQSTKHLCYESHECDEGREYVKAVKLSDDVSILKGPGGRVRGRGLRASQPSTQAMKAMRAMKAVNT